MQKPDQSELDVWAEAKAREIRERAGHAEQAQDRARRERQRRKLSAKARNEAAQRRPREP